MSGRLIAITLGFACVLGAGATIASHYVGRGPAQSIESEAAQPVPLFILSAQQADPRPSWPPQSRPVAFNEEMIALLTLGATTAMASADAHEDMKPTRRLTRQERRQMQQEERARLRAERAQEWDERRRARQYRADSDTVEVRVRDRQGRSLRIERVDREPDYERPRAYAPNLVRMFGPFGRW